MLVRHLLTVVGGTRLLARGRSCRRPRGVAGQPLGSSDAAALGRWDGVPGQRSRRPRSSPWATSSTSPESSPRSALPARLLGPVRSRATGSLRSTATPAPCWRGTPTRTRTSTRSPCRLTARPSTPAGFSAKVGGLSRKRVAAINASTGAVTSWAPAVEGKVYALAAVGSRVYLGGTVTKVNGVARTPTRSREHRGDAGRGVAPGGGRDRPGPGDRHRRLGAGRR